MAIQPGSRHTSPNKPRHALPRSPRTPHHSMDAEEDPANPPSSQIYVLSADGSSLFRLDPSKPTGEEEPPPYAPFRITPPEIHSPPGQDEETAGGIGLGIDRAGSTSPSSSRMSGLPPTARSHQHRPRASTFDGIPREHVINIETPPRHLVRNHNSFTYDTQSRSARSTRSLRPPNHRHGSIHSSRSSPGVRYDHIPDERQPLLSPENDWEQVEYYPPRGRWRAIFCGEVEEGEETNTWKGGWKRYWRTLSNGVAWRGLVHLILINFPFALAVWPFLLVGTLVGTVLLITLPLGAAVWWITLFLTRSAARLELITQLHHHAPLSSSAPNPTYHPIFYRIKERTRSSSPITPTVDLTSADSVGARESQEVIEWERRFIKCSYAMFSDHYSYSALVYFLLIKPLLVVLPTIFIIALLPISAVLIIPLPIYLRAARRWGRWQAGIAVANL